MNMIARFRLLPFILAGVAGAANAAGTAEPRLWPVPLGQAVSSNFCEYRDGRFHAGIDVRTYGREGVACRAVADGSVTRVRAGSLGYGKALYVTLEDGDEVVYAHLAEFMPALEESLTAAQRRAGAYDVDFQYPRGAVPVKRGQVIAYSGATGTAGPHLHFETRVRDVAVNPFRRGFAVTDRERPGFTRIAFVPLDPDARVQGACLPQEIVPRRVRPGRYVIADTLRLSGHVGVAAGVIDRLNSASGKLAPYEMQVWADDSLVSRIALDRFPFGDAGEVDLLYHAGANRARGTALFELYQRDGESLDGRAFTGGGSLFAPGNGIGVHSGRVVALDVAGNRAEVSFVFTDARTVPRNAALNGPRAPNLTPDIGGAFFLDGFAVFPRQTRKGATGGADGDAAPVPGDRVLRASEMTGRLVPLARTAGEDTATVYVTGFARGSAAAMRFPGMGVEVAVAADALYTDAVVFATRAGTDRVRASDGLLRMSVPVRIGPVGWVTRRGFVLCMDAPGNGERDAIYRFDDRRRTWTYVSGTRDGDTITGRSSRPGVFAILRDTTPPWLGAPRLEWPSSYFTGEPQAEINVPVEDRGAGIDERRITVTVGGIERYARWDFAKKIIVVPLRGEPIIGPQSVQVVVFDKVGNRSVADATIVFERP